MQHELCKENNSTRIIDVIELVTCDYRDDCFCTTGLTFNVFAASQVETQAQGVQSIIHVWKAYRH